MTFATITDVVPYGPHDTVIVFKGEDQATGDTLTFGIDHRPARNLIEQFWHGWSPEVDLEDWQILSRTASTAVSTGGTTS